MVISPFTCSFKPSIKSRGHQEAFSKRTVWIGTLFLCWNGVRLWLVKEHVGSLSCALPVCLGLMCVDIAAQLDTCFSTDTPTPHHWNTSCIAILLYTSPAAFLYFTVVTPREPVPLTAFKHFALWAVLELILLFSISFPSSKVGPCLHGEIPSVSLTPWVLI